jgi:hypothetical protein
MLREKRRRLKFESEMQLMQEAAESELLRDERIEAQVEEQIEQAD